MTKDDTRLNEIIRVVKRPNSYTMLDTGYINNCNLSWKAKGILTYLLSKPNNWKAITSDIVNHATDGKGSVYKALNELKENGYYHKTPIRDEKGVFIRWDSVVFEVPNAESLDTSGVYPLPNNPEMDNPKVENPFMDNPPLTIFNNNYIECSNIQSSQSGQNGQDKDRTDERSIQQYTDFIKSGIRYDELIVTNTKDIKLIDEFIAVILDTILTETKTVRIEGKDKPMALVKGNLLKLDYSDIEHCIWQFKAYTKPIAKKKQFILTMLYNCKGEKEAHLINTLPPQNR